MATSTNTYVHLETMEITENQSKEPDEARDAGMEGVSERKHKKGVLGYCK